MLQGGDATLPLSTDAATANALAKRDANGDIAFRDIAARDVKASGKFSGLHSNIVPDEVIHCPGLTAGENLLAGLATVSVPTSLTRIVNYKTKYSGTLRIKFTLGSVTGYITYAQIYKNGNPFGTLRAYSGDGTQQYIENLAFDDGDLIQVYSYSTYSTPINVFTNFGIYANVAPVVYGFI
jgi:hypothetical protein